MKLALKTLHNLTILKSILNEWIFWNYSYYSHRKSTKNTYIWILANFNIWTFEEQQLKPFRKKKKLITMPNQTQKHRSLEIFFIKYRVETVSIPFCFVFLRWNWNIDLSKHWYYWPYCYILSLLLVIAIICYYFSFKKQYWFQKVKLILKTQYLITSFLLLFFDLYFIGYLQSIHRFLVLIMD
jgi:hypothetical protein